MPRNKVLLVGFCPNNFPQEILESPRLCFWHRTVPANDRKNHIPNDVSIVILVPRFCGKERISKIRAMLEPGIELLTRFTGTGQVKKYLEEQGYVVQLNGNTVTSSKGSRTIGEMYAQLVPQSMQLPPLEVPQLSNENDCTEPKSETNSGSVAQEIVVGGTQKIVEIPAQETLPPTIKSPRMIFSEALDFINLAVQELVLPQKAILERSVELETEVTKLSADLEQEKINTASLLKNKEAELEILRENNRKLNSQVREIPKLRDAKTLSTEERKELISLREMAADMKQYKFIRIDKKHVAAIKIVDIQEFGGLEEIVLMELEQLLSTS